jgi:hypothetical protein
VQTGILQAGSEFENRFEIPMTDFDIALKEIVLFRITARIALYMGRYSICNCSVGLCADGIHLERSRLLQTYLEGSRPVWNGLGVPVSYISTKIWLERSLVYASAPSRCYVSVRVKSSSASDRHVNRARIGINEYLCLLVVFLSCYCTIRCIRPSRLLVGSMFTGVNETGRTTCI